MDLTWWYDFWTWAMEHPVKFSLAAIGISLALMIVYGIILSLIEYIHNRRIRNSYVWYTNGKYLYRKNRY